MVRNRLIVLLMALLVTLIALGVSAVMVLPNAQPFLVVLLSIAVGCAARIALARKALRGQGAIAAE